MSELATWQNCTLCLQQIHEHYEQESKNSTLAFMTYDLRDGDGFIKQKKGEKGIPSERKTNERAQRHISAWPVG